ncbi:hypothetical protein O181_104855 [Austropuccinia psidii MF-1]|uniref:CCHC-type domain-containing protein n=1 Tax=Austropuccinia psidii MF-1 TaxID=1389203 RepID=A0A9Q3JKN8_9BASI|nr:hypothetical protein [Austropuccinia psidii MF-1]
MSQKMVHMKIFKKGEGELENSLRSRCIQPCSTEEYINVMEDIVTRTKIGRKWKKLDIKSMDKPREPFKLSTSNTNVQRKFHKCGGIGHLANNCLKNASISETVGTEDQNDQEDESDSEKDTDESKLLTVMELISLMHKLIILN